MKEIKSSELDVMNNKCNDIFNELLELVKENLFIVLVDFSKEERHKLYRSIRYPLYFEKLLPNDYHTSNDKMNIKIYGYRQGIIDKLNDKKVDEESEDEEDEDEDDEESEDEESEDEESEDEESEDEESEDEESEEEEIYKKLYNKYTEGNVLIINYKLDQLIWKNKVILFLHFTGWILLYIMNISRVVISYPPTISCN